MGIYFSDSVWMEITLSWAHHSLLFTNYLLTSSSNSVQFCRRCHSALPFSRSTTHQRVIKTDQIPIIPSLRRISAWSSITHYGFNTFKIYALSNLFKHLSYFAQLNFGCFTLFHGVTCTIGFIIKFFSSMVTLYVNTCLLLWVQSWFSIPPQKLPLILEYCSRASPFTVGFLTSPYVIKWSLKIVGRMSSVIYKYICIYQRW